MPASATKAEKQLATTAEQQCRQLFSSPALASDLLPALQALRATWEAVATATIDQAAGDGPTWNATAKQRAVTLAGAIAQIESSIAARGDGPVSAANGDWSSIVCGDFAYLQKYLASGLPVTDTVTANLVALGAIFQSRTPTPPKTPSKKGWIIGGILAVILVGGAIVYSRQQRD